MARVFGWPPEEKDCKRQMPRRAHAYGALESFMACTIINALDNQQTWSFGALRVRISS